MNDEIIDFFEKKELKLTDYDLYIINKKKRNNTFSNFPRWKRKNKYVKLKGVIRKENLRWGHRLFYTDDYIDPEARCSWCDFYFPSAKNKFTVYFASIYSCQEALVEIAETALESRLNDLRSKYIGDSWKMKVCKRDAWGKPLTYTEVEPDRYFRTWSELGNLSYYDYRKKQITTYLQENKPPVYEKYIIHLNKSGSGGLFLEMMVDEGLITADIINKRIEHFYNLNEPLKWESDNPVPEDHLIYSSDWRKEKQLNFSNMLINPVRV